MGLVEVTRNADEGGLGQETRRRRERLEEAICHDIVEGHEAGVELLDIGDGKGLHALVRGIAAHGLEKMRRELMFSEKILGEVIEFVVGVGGDHCRGVHVETWMARVELLHTPEGPDHPGEASLDTADAIVSLGETIDGKVQVDRQLRAAYEEGADHPLDGLCEETVRWEVDRLDPVMDIERFDDLDEVIAQEGLAAGEPELVEGGRCLGDPLDLLEGHISVGVQLAGVKAGFALRVAARGDEEEDGLELFQADDLLEKARFSHVAVAFGISLDPGRGGLFELF